ncbi:hypothetical protein ACTVJH_13495 [Desulfoplanes sp. PS50]|jgi:antirestriction protein
MSEKKYRIQTACPQCGCSAAAVMTDEEIRKRYGDAPNIHVTCDKCRAEYEAKMADACPEWDEACKMDKQGKA